MAIGTIAKEKRRLRIVGTKTNLTIRGCLECPLFDRGCGFEYHSQCSLTFEGGESIFSDYSTGDEPSVILSKCPLPKVEL